MSTDMAKEICDNYVEKYLQKLSRTNSQRSTAYNNTIRMVSDACVYDVAITGNADVSITILYNTFELNYCERTIYSTKIIRSLEFTLLICYKRHSICLHIHRRMKA